MLGKSFKLYYPEQSELPTASTEYSFSETTTHTYYVKAICFENQANGQCVTVSFDNFSYSTIRADGMVKFFDCWGNVRFSHDEKSLSTAEAIVAFLSGN